MFRQGWLAVYQPKATHPSGKLPKPATSDARLSGKSAREKTVVLCVKICIYVIFTSKLFKTLVFIFFHTSYTLVSCAYLTLLSRFHHGVCAGGGLELCVACSILSDCCCSKRGSKGWFVLILLTKKSNTFPVLFQYFLLNICFLPIDWEMKTHNTEPMNIYSILNTTQVISTMMFVS